MRIYGLMATWAGDTADSIMRITVGADAISGTYPLTVVGTGLNGTITEWASFTLIVLPTEASVAGANVGLAFAFMGIGVGVAAAGAGVAIAMSGRQGSEVMDYGGYYYCRKHRVPLWYVEGKLWCPLHQRHVRTEWAGSRDHESMCALTRRRAKKKTRRHAVRKKTVGQLLTEIEREVRVLEKTRTASSVYGKKLHLVLHPYAVKGNLDSIDLSRNTRLCLCIPHDVVARVLREAETSPEKEWSGPLCLRTFSEVLN
jgi:uncharacterized Zn finger protein (UPF0148 family)